MFLSLNEEIIHFEIIRFRYFAIKHFSWIPIWHKNNNVKYVLVLLRLYVWLWFHCVIIAPELRPGFAAQSDWWGRELYTPVWRNPPHHPARLNSRAPHQRWHSDWPLHATRPSIPIVLPPPMVKPPLYICIMSSSDLN